MEVDAEAWPGPAVVEVAGVAGPEGGRSAELRVPESPERIAQELTTGTGVRRDAIEVDEVAPSGACCPGRGRGAERDEVPELSRGGRSGERIRNGTR
eukprot:15446019-Alexandrium_andersonii.AAC.1